MGVRVKVRDGSESEGWGVRDGSESEGWGVRVRDGE